MSQFKFFDDYEFEYNIPTFVRGVSNDMFNSQFYCPKQEHIDLNQTQFQTIPEIKEIDICEQSLEIPKFANYKRAKETRTKIGGKQKKDYKKNICGYITKKIVRQFISPAYKEKINQLCEKYGCDYSECIGYYDNKIERITGPTHLDMLLNISRDSNNVKKCFKEFFIWFLRHRYLRYLIMEGKMQRKDIYVDYKNKTLLYLGSIDDENFIELHKNDSESKETSSLFTY